MGEIQKTPSPTVSDTQNSLIDSKLVNLHAFVHASDEVSFRWSGNRTLDPNTATLTAHDFYNHYNTPSESNATLKVDQIPTFFKSNVKKQKGPMLFFDMYIDWKVVNS